MANKKIIQIVCLLFVAMLGLYSLVYVTYGYAGHVQGVEQFSQQYCYAQRTISFNVTKIGSLNTETITLSTREPLKASNEVSQYSAISGTFSEYGLNEKISQTILGSYNSLFLPQSGDGYTISLSENFSTYILDPYGNGTQNWYNVTDNINPFKTSLPFVSGTYYTAILSSPRAMMNEFCQQYGYSNPVLINNSVSIETHDYPNNLLQGRQVDFISVGQSVPTNASAIGNVHQQVPIAVSIILVFVAIWFTLEICSLVGTGQMIFQNIVNIAQQQGQSNTTFPSDFKFNWTLPKIIQDILNNSYYQYLDGNISYSEFIEIWRSAVNATSAPSTLSLGYSYTDDTATAGIDTFTSITAFVRNLVNLILMIIMIVIIIVVIVYCVRFLRPSL